MRKGDHEGLMATLRTQLRGMDLPPGKDSPGNNDNLRWLSRCLAARNAGHARFAEACATLRALGHPVVGGPAS